MVVARAAQGFDPAIREDRLRAHPLPAGVQMRFEGHHPRRSVEDPKLFVSDVVGVAGNVELGAPSQVRRGAAHPARFLLVLRRVPFWIELEPDLDLKLDFLPDRVLMRLVEVDR